MPVSFGFVQQEVFSGCYQCDNLSLHLLPQWAVLFVCVSVCLCVCVCACVFVYVCNEKCSFVARSVHGLPKLVRHFTQTSASDPVSRTGFIRRSIFRIRA